MNEDQLAMRASFSFLDLTVLRALPVEEHLGDDS